MSSIYEEAILEANKLRELALENAKSAVMKNIEPKIKRMIDEQLLTEDADLPVDKKSDDEEDILLDLSGEGSGKESAEDSLGLGSGDASQAGDVEIGDEPVGLTLPDADGKVTLDLDSFLVEPAAGAGDKKKSDEDVVLNAESVKALVALLETGKVTEASIKREVKNLAAIIEQRGAIGSPEKIDEILRKIRHTYFCVREAGFIGDNERALLEGRLENMYDGLKRQRALQEQKRRATGNSKQAKKGSARVEEVKMSMKNLMKEFDLAELDEEESCDEVDEQDMVELDEADLELKITGLPDEVDPETVSVDVEGAEEEGMEDEDMGDDEMDMGGDDVASDDTGSLELSDDDVVEIDENVLRREIARIHSQRRAKSLREDAPDKKSHASFGGSKEDEGDTLETWDDADLNQLESRRGRGTRLAELRRGRRARLEQKRAVRENARLRMECGRLAKALKEANLFNAKMVYANKLLQRKSLTESQKAKIVNSLDSAGTVREVRLLYKSLTESLSTKKSLSESSQRAGSASRAGAPSGVRQGAKGSQDVLTESVEEEDRWALLAGIKG